MALRITFSEDVVDISTAANANGSIRWHVYARRVAGRPAIYVQREVLDVLQAEVKITFEGDRPEVFFDVGLGQWVLLYRLHERFWMLRYAETEVPVPESIQTDVFVDAFQLSVADAAQVDSVAQRQAGLTESVPAVDAYNGPPPPLVGVGSSPTPGLFRVRWRPKESTVLDGNAQYNYEPSQFYIAGFHVYVQHLDSGRLERLSVVMVPFVGLDPHIYELEVPAVAGTYFVTQVNFAGPASTELVEGRIRSPRDLVRSDGTQLPDIVRSFMDAKMGDSLNDLRFVVVRFIPVEAQPPPDPFASHLGEQTVAAAAITADYENLIVADQGDTFPSHLGDGIISRFSQTGFDTIIIG